MSKKRKTTSITNVSIDFPTLAKFESSINEFRGTNPTEINTTFVRPVVPGYLTELFCPNNPFTTINCSRTHELKKSERKRKDFNKEKIRNYSVTENVTRDVRIKFNAKFELKNFKYFLDRNEAVENRDSVFKEKSFHDLKYYPNYDFVVDKRRTCLLDLAGKITLENIDKLDKIIKNEERSIRKETEALQKEKEENEENLKVACQRTYKAVRKADLQVAKKNKSLDKLKRASFVLAKLNSECIQLEEEYTTLKTYKQFLKKAFINRDKVEIGSKISFVSDLPLTLQIKDLGKDLTQNDSSEMNDENEDVKQKKTENENKKNVYNRNNDDILLNNNNDNDNNKVKTVSNITSSHRVSYVNKKNIANIALSMLDYPSSDDSGSAESYRTCYDPAELVNIFTNLEINNLSLIENVQEQEELCDYLKKRIESFKNEMQKQISDINDKISDESDKIDEINASIEWIEENNDALKKYNSITRYNEFFCLKDIELTTLDELLNFITEQIHNLYYIVFDSGESEKINSVKMLERIESLIDSYYVELQKYDKKIIMKTKKLIDERKRHANRVIQNKLNKEARAKKLQLAMAAFLLPPKYKSGRKIIYRSDPLKQISKRSQLNLEEIRQQEENDYFFT